MIAISVIVVALVRVAAMVVARRQPRPRRALPSRRAHGHEAEPRGRRRSPEDVIDGILDIRQPAPPAGRRAPGADAPTSPRPSRRATRSPTVPVPDPRAARQACGGLGILSPIPLVERVRACPDAAPARSPAARRAAVDLRRRAPAAAALPRRSRPCPWRSTPARGTTIWHDPRGRRRARRPGRGPAHRRPQRDAAGARARQSRRGPRRRPREAASGTGFTWRPALLEPLSIGVLRIDHVLSGAWLRPVATDVDCSSSATTAALLVSLERAADCRPRPLRAGARSAPGGRRR